MSFLAKCLSLQELLKAYLEKMDPFSLLLGALGEVSSSAEGASRRRAGSLARLVLLKAVTVLTAW